MDSSGGAAPWRCTRQGSQGSGGAASSPSTPNTDGPVSIPPPPPPPPSGGSMPPPPPPIAASIPAVRLKSEIGPRLDKGPPLALAGAMMKDKKPFTYTPGGIDLSEIRSPRMQKRIAMNAQAEGVSSTPSQQHYNPSGSNDSGPPHPPLHLPPAAMAAMNPAMHIPVLPAGAFDQSNLNRSHKPSDFVRQEHYNQQQQQQNQSSVPHPPTFLPPTLQQQIQQHQFQRQQHQHQPPPPPPRSQSPQPPLNTIPLQVMNNVSGQNPRNYMTSNNTNNNNSSSSSLNNAEQTGMGSIYIPPLSSNNNNNSSSSGNIRGSSPSPSFNASQLQQQTRPTHQTKAQARSQNLGSIYIPPIEQRPSVFSERQNNNNDNNNSNTGDISSPSTVASTPQTPQLNKAPTPWMNSYSRMQSQQGSNSPQSGSTTPWGVSVARTIPITISRGNNEDDNNNSSLQQQQQQQQQNYYPQQQQQSPLPPWLQQQQQQPQQFSGGPRVVPIQIERHDDGRNTPNSSSGARTIPIQIEGSANTNVRRGPSSGNQTPSTPGFRSNPMNAKDAFSKQAAELSAGIDKMSTGDEGYRTVPIQSKSFRVIQRIADDDNRQAEEERRTELIEADKELMENTKAEVDEPSTVQAEPRFRGGHNIPFRTTPQSPGAQQDFTPNYPTQQTSSVQSTTHNIPIRMVSMTPPTQQQQYNRVPASQQQVAEPKKYTGSNIPSRSFKILQAMTGGPADEETSASIGSESEAGADKTPRQSPSPTPQIKHRINLASRPPRPPCRSLSSTPTPSSPQNQVNNPQNFVRSRTVSPSPTPRTNTCTCNCQHNKANNYNNYNNNNNNSPSNYYYTNNNNNGYNNYSQSESESEDYVMPTPRSYSPWIENYDPNFDPYAYMQYYYWWYYNYGVNHMMMQNQNYYPDPYQQQQQQMNGYNNNNNQYTEQQQQQQYDGTDTNGGEYYNDNNGYIENDNDTNSVPKIIIDKSRESPSSTHQETTHSYHEYPLTSESEEFTTGEWTETEPENEMDETPRNNNDNNNSSNYYSNSSSSIKHDNNLVKNQNLKESVVNTCDSEYDNEIIEMQKSVLLNGNEESEFDRDDLEKTNISKSGNSFSSIHNDYDNNKEEKISANEKGLNVNVIRDDSKQETVPYLQPNDNNSKKFSNNNDNSEIFKQMRNNCKDDDNLLTRNDKNFNTTTMYNDRDRFETFIEDDNDDDNETEIEDGKIRASEHRTFLSTDDDSHNNNNRNTHDIYSSNNNNEEEEDNDNHSICTNSGVVEEPETPSISEEDASTLVNEPDAFYSRGVDIEECYSQSSETEDEIDMDVEGQEIPENVSSPFNYNYNNNNANNNNNNNMGPVNPIPHHRLSTIQELSERTSTFNTAPIPFGGDDEDTNAEDISEDEDTTDDGSSVSVIENKSDVNNDWSKNQTNTNHYLNGACSTASSSDAEDGNDDDPLLPATITTAQLPLTLSFSKSTSLRDITTVLVGDSQVERKLSNSFIDDDDDNNNDHKEQSEGEEEDQQFNNVYADCAEVTTIDDDYSTGPVGVVEEVETEAEFSIVENQIDENQYDEDEPVVSFTISLSRSTSKSIGKKCEEDSESGEDLEVDQDVVLNIAPMPSSICDDANNMDDMYDSDDIVVVLVPREIEKSNYEEEEEEEQQQTNQDQKEGEIDFWGVIQKEESTVKESSPNKYFDNYDDNKSNNHYYYNDEIIEKTNGNWNSSELINDDDNDDTQTQDSWILEEQDNELQQIMSNDEDNENEDDDRLWDRFNSYDTRKELATTIQRRLQRNSETEAEEQERRNEIERNKIEEDIKKTQEKIMIDKEKNQSLVEKISSDTPDFWEEIASDSKLDDNCKYSGSSSNSNGNNNNNNISKPDETVNFWERPARFEAKRFARQFSWEVSCDEDDTEKNQQTDSIMKNTNPIVENNAIPSSTNHHHVRYSGRKESLAGGDETENSSKNENVKRRSESIEIEKSTPSSHERIQIQSEEVKSKTKNVETGDGFTRSTEKRCSADELKFKEIKSEVIDNVAYYGNGKDSRKASTTTTTTKTTVKSSTEEIENCESKIDTIFSNRKLENCEFPIKNNTPQQKPPTPLSNAGNFKKHGKNKESKSKNLNNNGEKYHADTLLQNGCNSADENSDESSSTFVPENLRGTNRNSGGEFESEVNNKTHSASNHTGTTTTTPSTNAREEERSRKSSSPVFELTRTTSLTKKEINERNVEIKETREKFKLGPNGSNNINLEPDGNHIETLDNGNGMSVSRSSSDCQNGSEKMNRAEDLLWRIERFLQESLSLGSEDDSGVMTDISRQISDADTDNDIETEVVPRRQKNNNNNSNNNLTNSQSSNNDKTNRSLKTRSMIETSSSVLESSYEAIDKTKNLTSSNGVVMRNMTADKKSLRYQRAKTHSRLFQLLQDEYTKDEETTLEDVEEMIDFENLEQVEAAIEKSNNRRGVSNLKDTVISSTDEMQDGNSNSRLVPLPIKNFLTSSSMDSETSSSSGVLSPVIKKFSDIIQEFQLRHQHQTKRKVSNFPSKIFKLLQEEFGEEFYSFNFTEDDLDFPSVKAQELLPVTEDSNSSGTRGSGDIIKQYKEINDSPTSLKTADSSNSDISSVTTDNVDSTSQSNSSKKTEYLEVPPRRKKILNRDPRVPKNINRKSHIL